MATKFTSKFIDKIHAETRLLKAGIQVAGTLPKMIDDFKLGDDQVLDATREILFNKADSRMDKFFEEKSVPIDFVKDCEGLGPLLFDDISQNFKLTQIALSRGLKDDDLLKFKKFPNIFTLGAYMKYIFVQLKTLENKYKNMMN